MPKKNEGRAKQRQIRVIPGLGPKSTQALAVIGIRTLEELKARDVYDVYRELKMKVPGTSLNFMYGLIAAVEGGDWREVSRLQRTEILLRLDAMGLAPK